MAENPADPHNAWFRQVITYWEMAAAMVLHGAVSAELFVDCNGEGFFLLAKFAPILEAIREKNPTFLTKTSDLVNRFSAAAQRYEAILKRVDADAEALAGQNEALRGRLFASVRTIIPLVENPGSGSHHRSR